MKNIPTTCFLEDGDAAVVGEFDGIGEVRRHVEGLSNVGMAFSSG